MQNNGFLFTCKYSLFLQQKDIKTNQYSSEFNPAFIQADAFSPVFPVLCGVQYCAGRAFRFMTICS
jgi:hypothetical protein